MKKSEIDTTPDNESPREEITLLRDCSRALNEIPRKRLTGKYRDSYQLAAAIDEFFRRYDKPA